MRPKIVLVTPVCARFGDLAVEEFLHAAIAFEIFGDEFRGFFLVNAELLGEAEGGKAVNHAEIDDFGDAAMLAGLRERRDVENFLRGARVDVFAAAESFDQHGIVGKMSEDAQFDLRVVGGKQQTARRGDEGGANFAAELGAYRNILQIRIRGAEAAGDGAGLRETRVQAAGDRMDQARQHVGIGGFELGQLAVFDDFLGQFVDGAPALRARRRRWSAPWRGCGAEAAAPVGRKGLRRVAAAN